MSHGWMTRQCQHFSSSTAVLCAAHPAVTHIHTNTGGISIHIPCTVLHRHSKWRRMIPLGRERENKNTGVPCLSVKVFILMCSAAVWSHKPRKKSQVPECLSHFSFSSSPHVSPPVYRHSSSFTSLSSLDKLLLKIYFINRREKSDGEFINFLSGCVCRTGDDKQMPPSHSSGFCILASLHAG